jgi:hypothetical protein
LSGVFISSLILPRSLTVSFVSGLAHLSDRHWLGPMQMEDAAGPTSSPVPVPVPVPVPAPDSVVSAPAGSQLSADHTIMHRPCTSFHPGGMPRTSSLTLNPIVVLYRRH